MPDPGDTIAEPVAAEEAVAGPRRNMTAVAHEALRGMIVRGVLPPGKSLSQVSLARELGVSTTPLREALRQLEAEGLIESRPNGRSRVPPFDVEDLGAVYSSRILLEGLAITLAVPRMDTANFEQLQGHLAAMKGAAAEREIARWHAAHGDFHAALVAPADAVLRRQVAALASRSDRYRLMSVLADQPSSWAVGDADHEAILDACEKREAELAARRLAENLARSALILVAHLAPGTDPAGVRIALQMVTARAEPGVISTTKPDEGGES